MIISAQLSLYPLRQEHLSPAIEAVSDALRAAGLQPQVGAMSTLVTGAAATIFAVLHTAFVRVAGMGQVVMTVTLSNACPVGEGHGETQGHF